MFISADGDEKLLQIWPHEVTGRISHPESRVEVARTHAHRPQDPGFAHERQQRAKQKHRRVFGQSLIVLKRRAAGRNTSWHRGEAGLSEREEDDAAGAGRGIASSDRGEDTFSGLPTRTALRNMVAATHPRRGVHCSHYFWCAFEQQITGGFRAHDNAIDGAKKTGGALRRGGGALEQEKGPRFQMTDASMYA